MTSLSSQSLAEFQADSAAVSATNFCSLWPAGKSALQALQGVVSSSVVRFAISTVIAAGDAYCGSHSDIVADAAMATEDTPIIPQTWIVHSDVIITNR
jgi:hypothetical protein